MRLLRVKLLLGIATCLTALFAAGGAQAAQRFAAPEGKGAEPCATKEAACSLTVAITGAKEGDEVIVTGGSYSLSSQMFSNVKNVYVHGDFGGPMPRINASTSGSPISLGEGFRIAYLEMFNTSATFPYGFFCAKEDKIERVRVQVLTAGSGYGVYEYENCLVRDSVVHIQGENAFGLFTPSAGVPVNRNLTVVASGPGSYGISVNNGGIGAVDLRNTILSGEAGDLLLSSKSKAFIGTSNFDSPKLEPEAAITDLGGNQTAPPLFVDAAKGDYHEALGSPTIDAGAVDQLGTLDFDGNPRVIGAAPDIGAYEFVPPVPQIQSLAVSPGAFRTGKVAGAIASAKKKPKPSGPVGATVSYSLSAAGSVEFSLIQKGVGRKAGKKCVRKTAANKSKKKCVIAKALKGGFSVSGAAGPNSFKFSGKLAGKALAPGSYRLFGSAGGVTKEAAFTILK